MRISSGFIYFFGALGGLLFGFDSGIVAGAMTPIEENFGLSAAQTGFMTGAVLLGSALGALVVGRLSDKFGRKKLLIVASVIFVVGAIASAAAVGFISICAARIFLGLGIGIASAVVPAYLSELAPAKTRGTISTLFQFMIVAGLMTSYIVDLAFLNSSLFGLENWQLMLGSASIPAVLLFIGSFLIPESPRFLVSDGKIDDARIVLNHLRKNDLQTVNQELQEIEESASFAKGGVSDLFKVARPALIAAAGLAILQQFIGINAVFYYGPVIADDIMPAVTDTANHAQLHQDLIITFGFGVVNFFATIIAIFVMDRFGRKTLLYIGSIIMGVGAFILAATKYGLTVSPAVSLFLVAIYIIGFAISWGPIVWVLIGEIFPLSVRGVGASIATACNWFANFAMMFIFPIVIQEVNGIAQHIEYGFIIFGAFSLLSILFVKFLVPETKGKTLEEIEAGFRRNL